MRRRQAFTLIELMVVIAVIAALASILVPVVAGMIEKSRFTGCGANFNSLGKQLKIYDTNLTGVFPSCVPLGNISMLPTAGAMNTANAVLSATTVSNTLPSATLGGNPMQQIWPLIASGGIGPNGFRCPGDPGWLTRSTTSKYGWTSLREFSYGVQWPFAGTVNGTGVIQMKNLATPYGKKREDRLILMADRNPGAKVSATKQHSNHPNLGANGIDAGGNQMRWEETSNSLCGMDGDNIYTDEVANGRVAVGARQNDWVPDATNDTVITPIISR